MALKPCGECKREISGRAKVCPHCGIKKPHEPAFIRGLHTAANACMGLGCLLILGVPLVMFLLSQVVC